MQLPSLGSCPGQEKWQLGTPVGRGVPVSSTGPQSGQPSLPQGGQCSQRNSPNVKCLSSHCSHGCLMSQWSKAATWPSPASVSEGPLPAHRHREVRLMEAIKEPSIPVNKCASFLSPQRDSSKVCPVQSQGSPDVLSPAVHGCNLLTETSFINCSLFPGSISPLSH